MPEDDSARRCGNPWFMTFLNCLNSHVNILTICAACYHVWAAMHMTAMTSELVEACRSSSHCTFCLTEIWLQLLRTVTNATSHNADKMLARLVLASSCHHVSVTDIFRLGDSHCIMHQQNEMASPASDAWLYRAPCSCLATWLA